MHRTESLKIVLFFGYFANSAEQLVHFCFAINPLVHAAVFTIMGLFSSRNKTQIDTLNTDRTPWFWLGTPRTEAPPIKEMVGMRVCWWMIRRTGGWLCGRAGGWVCRWAGRSADRQVGPLTSALAGGQWGTYAGMLEDEQTGRWVALRVGGWVCLWAGWLAVLTDWSWDIRVSRLERSDL